MTCWFLLRNPSTTRTGDGKIPCCSFVLSVVGFEQVSDARYSLSDKDLSSSLVGGRPVVIMIGVDHHHMNNTASGTILWGTKIAFESTALLRGSTRLFLGQHGIDNRLFAFTFALDCTAGVVAATRPFCVSVAKHPQGGLRYEHGGTLQKKSRNDYSYRLQHRVLVNSCCNHLGMNCTGTLTPALVRPWV